MARRRNSGDAGAGPHTFEQEKYEDWRSSELLAQAKGLIKTEDVEGKDVLDFGCGHGALSFVVADWQPKSVTAIDAAPDRIAAAQARSELSECAVMPDFRIAHDLSTIDLEDSSIDTILCFDVLEHIMDYKSIIHEWRRILRPGGRIVIWWVPWWNPYGPHIESLVPIPWAHFFFSDRVLIETCANIYDHDTFKPRIWDLDENGGKKPNKWRSLDSLPTVNRLTIGRFQKLAKHSDFVIEERVIHGFSSSGIKRASHLLTRLPFVGEFFTSFVTYRLRPND